DPSPFNTAPGVNILASVPPSDGNGGFSMGKLTIQTGTSMACPYVSDNAGKPITNESEAFASPHEMGAGEVSPSHPGLVYETNTTDYLNFLCYFGYNTTVLRSMVDLKFTFPANSSEDIISDINYPSISIAELRGALTITRTVTNVGHQNSNYTVKIVFGSSVSLETTFDGKAATTKGYKFGSVTWSDGRHLVRLVFAVNVI
ncbi:hypothetical protein MKX03_037526, partial [Papaver bracteatum]